MPQKLKDFLFGLFFVLLSTVFFTYCFGDATLYLFRSLPIRGFLLDAYLFVMGCGALYVSVIFFRSIFRKK